MVVRVIDITGKAATAADGEAVRAAIEALLKAENPVVLSFEKIPFVTSSFLNSSLIYMAEKLGESGLKSSLKVTNANRQIAETIRRRITMHFNHDLSSESVSTGSVQKQ